jgi:hypothetical protein
VRPLDAAGRRVRFGAVPGTAWDPTRFGYYARGVLILSDLGSVDLKGGQSHHMRWLFVVPALGVGTATAHREVACGNRDHVAGRRIAYAEEKRGAGAVPNPRASDNNRGTRLGWNAPSSRCLALRNVSATERREREHEAGAAIVGSSQHAMSKRNLQATWLSFGPKAFGALRLAHCRSRTWQDASAFAERQPTLSLGDDVCRQVPRMRRRQPGQRQDR